MEKNIVKISRALISVSDKTDIVLLAKTLQSFNCEIISTGGTKKTLEEAGIKIVDISNFTGNPEAFGGKMKTISFNVESALLFDREKESEEAEKLGIKPIDMVVCNLYPFKKYKEANADLDTLIHNIDIGGPTMIRAGAKNFKFVAVITDVSDYQYIIDELKANDGGLSLDTRAKLMRKAFNYTADYDALISTTMDERFGNKSLRFSFVDGKELRYGENPHQKGFFFKEKDSVNSLYDMKILGGKELSFNNIIDINSAIESVRTLKKSACAIIKHNNPCGLCEGENQRRTIELAWAGDPISAFGSIIAFNKPVEKETVEFLRLNDEDKKERKFIEVIVAPKFLNDSIEYLKFNENLRIIEYDIESSKPDKDIKYMSGSLLLQEIDNQLLSKLEVVTERKPEIDEELFEFGIKAVRQIKSNAIVIVRRTKDGYLQLLGMGAGQPNRLISTNLAVAKCKENLTTEYEMSVQQRNNSLSEQIELEDYIKSEMAKAVLVSDAFFPFPDNVEVSANAGIKTILQPGGSIRDKAVIKKCNELGVAMIFTGIRHFKH